MRKASNERYFWSLLSVGRSEIMFKNRPPPICDIFGNYDICWDKFWSISSTFKFIILWKSQEKMLSIDISHIYGGFVEAEKNELRCEQIWRLMVSALHWGVIFQIHHMIEKIWWWGINTNGLKSPNDLYLQAKNKNMSSYGGYIYSVTLPYSIERYFAFWLVLRDDNAVLVSLITKKLILSNYGG